jgi:monofunctional biosynthetic peptidoglycan transglycosylase
VSLRRSGGARIKKRRSLLRLFLGALMAGLSLLLAYQLYLFCMVVWYSHKPPASSSVMRAELSRLRESDPDIRLQYSWASYSQINNTLKRAVVASEDSQFTEHDGVEWDAIRKAWEYNQRQAELGHDKVRGGSTITQQLAKNLFLQGNRNYLRKGQELVLAYMIERVMSKQRILELYLNIAEWGVGVFGAQAAAQHYYKTDAANLTSAQAATLAAMLPNPRYYDSHRGTRYLNLRTGIVQRRMTQVDIP